jgi:YHS domain-containing protein
MNDIEPMSVCGGRLTNPERYPSALYRGARVYFCLRACRRAFEADPDRFMAGEIPHPEHEDPLEDIPAGGPL